MHDLRAIRDNPQWQQALACAADLPEDLQGLFLFVARTAIEQAPCPSDSVLAEVYGTHSHGRARRLLGYLEERGALVCRIDFAGQRILALPMVGAETAPGSPNAATTDTPENVPAEQAKVQSNIG